MSPDPSMEAGERWMLNDVTGKPIRAWDSRGHIFRTEYDPLRRPVRSFVEGSDPQNPAAEILFAKTDYGEGQPNDIQLNLRTRPLRQYDGAGMATNEEYDFKGNLLSSTRQLARDYKTAPDWSANPALEPETFTSATTYDTLNRAITVTAPDKSIYRPTFNEANLLEKVDVNLRGAATITAFVTNIDYNAKGQRTLIQYGNGAAMAYEYDDKTFRLTHLKTTRGPGLNGVASQIFANAATVQDLNYNYDPAGNIIHIEDAALKTIFNGQNVDPACDYTYDPLYRLIKATGREHIGQSVLPFTPPDGNYRDYPFVGTSQQNNLQALRNYTELYDYDPVGNFKTMSHLAGSGAGNWTRTYAYNEPNLIEPGKQNNRLTTTTVAGATEPYSYDAHGNITQMPHLPMMQWDFKDQLSATSRQVVNAGATETTYYVYDAGGQRARKVTERQNGTRKNTRVYLGGFEVYREFAAGGSITLERETLHIMDDKQRIALIETQTIANGAAIASPTPAQRYQLGNHLGSASLELDDSGQIISYEEYYPYGSTSYQAGRSGAEASLKRYRFTGKERDEETGFTYHGARYYAPWMGRWTSCDPAGLVDGPNLYSYVQENPVRLLDPSGRESETDKRIAQMTDPQLHAYLKSLSPEARGEFASSATGNFRARVSATLTQGKLETIPIDTTTVEQQDRSGVFTVNGTDYDLRFYYAVPGRNGLLPVPKSPSAMTDDELEAWAEMQARTRIQAKQRDILGSAENYETAKGVGVLLGTAAVTAGVAVESGAVAATLAAFSKVPYWVWRGLGAIELMQAQNDRDPHMLGMIGMVTPAPGPPTVKSPGAGSVPAGKMADKAALSADVAEALVEARQSTITLYHGGELESGLDPTRPFSTTTSLTHAEQYAGPSGRVYQFEIPTERFNEITGMQGVQRMQDSLQGTSSHAVEWRFNPSALQNNKLWWELWSYRVR